MGEYGELIPAVACDCLRLILKSVLLTFEALAVCTLKISNETAYNRYDAHNKEPRNLVQTSERVLYDSVRLHYFPDTTKTLLSRILAGK